MASLLADPGYSPIAQPVTTATSRAAAVELRDLTKSFAVQRPWRELVRRPYRTRYTQVLHGLTHTVYDGEFFGLLGPNGAGKTTLFKILAGFMQPDGGSATVLGRDVARADRRAARLVGCVMANDRSLYWRLSAAQNLELYGGLYGLTSADASRRTRELLSLVGLSDTRDKMVGMFSSGMKQRLLIARTLIPRPKLLLLDEPTRSLDPISARDFRAFLRHDLIEQQGCTILLATHSSEEALDLCDRIAVLNQGHLLATGTAEELSRRYDDQRFTVWMRDPDHPALDELHTRGVIRNVARFGPDRDGWAGAHMSIAGGAEGAADVINHLVAGGARVSRFERAGLSLADLLERVVSETDGGAT